MMALTGVGDKERGEWRFEGNNGVYHIQRRLNVIEATDYDVPDPYDIRGTQEEKDRITLF